MMKIKNFNSNVFYLGGWVSPPSEHYGNGKDFLNDQVFKDVKESGVNVLYTNIDRLKHLDDLKRMSLCAEKAGKNKYQIICVYRYTTFTQLLPSFYPRNTQLLPNLCTSIYHVKSV